MVKAGHHAEPRPEGLIGKNSWSKVGFFAEGLSLSDRKDWSYVGSARKSDGGNMIIVKVRGSRSWLWLNISQIEAVLHEGKEWCAVLERRSSLGSS